MNYKVNRMLIFKWHISAILNIKSQLVWKIERKWTLVEALLSMFIL